MACWIFPAVQSARGLGHGLVAQEGVLYCPYGTNQADYVSEPSEVTVSSFLKAYRIDFFGIVGPSYIVHCVSFLSFADSSLSEPTATQTIEYALSTA